MKSCHVPSYYDHLEGIRVASTMYVVLLSRSTNDYRIKHFHERSVERWGHGNAAQLAGDRIPNQEVFLWLVLDEDAAMAAASDSGASRDLQREARGWDPIWWLEHGSEYDSSLVEEEEADQRGFFVVGAELAQETGIGDHLGPSLADERGSEERGRQCWEKAKAISHDVVVVERGQQRRRFGRRLVPAVVFISLGKKWSL